MIRSIVISPNGTLAAGLEKVALTTPTLRIERVVDGYPTEAILMRVLRSHSPHLVFLSYEAEDIASDVAAQIELHVPGTQVVAVHTHRDEAALIAAIRSGVREFITAPFPPDEFLEALRRVAMHLERVPPAFHRAEGVFAFMPVKPGVGASTIAVNTSLAMTKEMGSGVLLGDLDVYSGIVSFMLQLRYDVATILDAAELSSRLDETLWSQLICELKDLDVLATARLKTGLRLDVMSIREILEYARRTYSAICLDLSGGFEDYNIEVLEEAKKILLVSTPEICALRLARDKIEFLRELELNEKVSLILNRTERSTSLPRAEIERIVGIPVMMSMPNDYGSVRKAVTNGQPVNVETELGAQFANLAATLLLKDTPRREPPRRRFLEQFTLAPYRMLFGDKN